MGETKFGVKQVNNPAPLWYRRLSNALIVFILPAAATFVADWGLPDVVAKRWLLVLSFLPALVKGIGVMLGNGEVYASKINNNMDKVVLLIISIVLLTGCITEKKQQGIAKNYFEKHPIELAKECMEKYPPKTGEIKQGATKTDTVTVTDSAALNRFQKRIDSLFKNPIVKVNAANVDSIRNALRNVLITQFADECKAMHVIKNRIDTLPVADSAAIKFWYGQFEMERDKRIKVEAELELKIKEANEFESKARKRWWIIAGLIAVFGLVTYLRIKRIL